jgi:serine/threonine protein kinase
MHFKRLASYPEETVDCLDDNAASEFVSGSLAASAIHVVESHLAACRDCRALVAALAGDEADSQAATRQHEKIEDSQVVKRPVLSVGDRVGRYLVLSSIGAGGMGVVFAAYDPQLDRKVALKLLRANMAGANAKEARTRLKREAQAIAQLNHPNVVGVYDVGTTDDDDVYIAMEFVEGDTLTSWLRKWPRTWREILEVFHQAARGLLAAHSVGLLHRDFKPDNVLVGGDGRVRVTDFGLARSVFLDDSARGPTTPSGSKPAHGSPLQVDLTATGTVLGTPRYMPPEQLTGPNIDARADQFSFCVALYEALWGTHPLPGATSVSMLEQGAKAMVPPDSSKVAPSIARAVLRGLEKDRAKRYPTLSALVHDLAPPVQRSPVPYIAAAAVAAVLVGGVAAAMMMKPNPTVRVETADEPTVAVLINEINRRDQEIKNLRRQIANSINDREELIRLRNELDQKQDDIRKLEDELIRAKVELSPVPVAKPLPPTNRQIDTAIKTVEDRVSFCLGELDSRKLATEGAPKSGEFAAVVKLRAAPDGRASHATVSGLDYTPGVRDCVSAALTDVTYPKGAEKIQIDINWAGGSLKMSGHALGPDEPTGSTLQDL